MPLLKATYAQEATLKKAANVEQKLRDMGLKSAAELYRKGVAETLTDLDFPHEHWRSIRTNNILERLNREIRRRTRVAGCFPDGESALMLVCARLRYVATKEWGTKRYLNMICEKKLDTTNDLAIKSDSSCIFFEIAVK